MDYLRYLWPGGFFIITGSGVMMGGAGCWFGVLLFPLVAIVEYFLEDDLRKRDMRPVGALFMLYIQLIPWLFLWYGLWRFLQTDYQWWEWLGTIISVGGITAAVGLPIAHELFHRHEGISRFFGDLFAVTLISGDVELEHRKGHHIETSTRNDIDTAYRGESVYAFIARLLPFFHYVTARSGCLVMSGNWSRETGNCMRKIPGILTMPKPGPAADRQHAGSEADRH